MNIDFNEYRVALKPEYFNHKINWIVASMEILQKKKPNGWIGANPLTDFYAQTDFFVQPLGFYKTEREAARFLPLQATASAVHNFCRRSVYFYEVFAEGLLTPHRT